ncbi:MAG TPA: hypothetical protein VIK63_03915 [Haloplasmataceae bacterium]
MLKQVSIHYVVGRCKSKNILPTFEKVAQKFGHIHTFVREGLLIQAPHVIQAMIGVAKRLNVKLTLISSLAGWEWVYHHAPDLFLEWVEQLDFIGIEFDDETDGQRIDRLAVMIWQINGNLALCTMGKALKDERAYSFPQTYDRWIVYTTGYPLRQTITNKKLQVNDCPYFVNPEGQFMSYDGLIHETINRSAKRLIEIMRHDAYKERFLQSNPFPYKVKLRDVQQTYYKVTSGKAAFFDVEAVSRKLTNVSKFPHIHDFPLPILYALVAIDEGELRVKERHSYSVSSPDQLETIYIQFYKTLKRLDIQYLVVRGAALERRFIENMIYVLRSQLNLEDFRYLLSLRDHLIDIQHLLQEPHNSDKLLTELKSLYPDLITFERKSEKLSIKISFILDGLIFGPKRHEETLQKIVHYCFEDVYADFELFKFLSFYTRYRL